MVRNLLLHVLIILQSPLLGIAKGDIFVDFKTGCDEESCLVSPTREQPCKTLDFTLTNLNSSSSIIVLSGEQPLNKSVELSNLTDISIEGENREVYINCIGRNVGLKFVEIMNFQLHNLTFQYCGANESSSQISNFNKKSPVFFRSALYFLKSTNILVHSVTVSKSSGVGIALFNTGGNISIESSRFSSNKVLQEEKEYHAGGGGIHIEAAMCSLDSLEPCDYQRNPYFITIMNSNFTDNEGTMPPNISTSSVGSTGPVVQMLGTGGGISLIMGNASYSSFTIVSCSFDNNTAKIGGGLAVVITGSARDNSVIVENSMFMNNTALTGGGAVEAGFFYAKNTSNNTIKFHNTTFIDNKADYGGGVSFFSTPFNKSIENSVTFSHCHWMRNSAPIGAAIIFYPDDWSVLSEGHLPTPTFTDCTFFMNYVSKMYHKSTEPNNLQIILGGGTVQSSGFNIKINKKVVVSDNNGSAFLMFTSQIMVQSNTDLLIENNTAIRGAGIALIGYSGLLASSNSTIRIYNNSATDVGGGIYYNTVDPFDYINSQHCFIRYEERIHPNKWNATFSFSNNRAYNKYGSSIFATTLQPCARATKPMGSGSSTASRVFHWDSFSFDNLSAVNVISTEPATIDLNTTNLSTAPGVECTLNVALKDDLKQSVDTVLMVKASEHVLETYHYISDNQIAFEGNRNDTFLVSVQTINSRQIGIEFNVHLNNCPPGYVFNSITKRCICSVSATNKTIPGIIGCNESESRGILQVGYWAGCIDGKLVTAQCPLGYCKYEDSYNGLFTLAKNCTSLEDALCSPQNRGGVLCGECKVNLSVLYHSTRFKCAECEHKDLGWLFYILSELLPLTIVFIFVITFDVSLTSGSANALIFFAQVLDFFQTTAFNSYTLPPIVDYLTEAYWFIFGFFNLDFFRLDELSFCLKENADVLFILCVKYITTAYGILLIVILFFLIRCCKCNKILQKCRGQNQGTYSITYGVTAFIILSYSQCAKVSFQILTETELKGSMNDNKPKTVMFLTGQPFFGSHHIGYGILALFVVIFLALIPIFLILNPLYYMFKNLVIERHLISSMSVTYHCFEVFSARCSLFLKPILDAFQGCYKDNVRFFAGMYFLYRFLATAAFAFATTALSMYGILEALILIILVIHAIAQPYRKKFHNILDALIFGDLAIVNGISMYNFASTQYMSDVEYFEILACIQVFLIYLPVICMVVLIFLKFISYFHFMRKKMKRLNEYISIISPQQLENDRLAELSDPEFEQEEDIFDSTHLPHRMIQEPHVRHSSRENLRERLEIETHRNQGLSQFQTRSYGATRNERKTC